MGAIDHLAIVTLGADDAREGLLLSDRSALESERGGLAVFSDAAERCSAFATATTA